MMAVEGSQGLSIRTMMTTAYLLNHQVLRKSWLLEFQGSLSSYRRGCTHRYSEQSDHIEYARCAWYGTEPPGAS